MGNILIVDDSQLIRSVAAEAVRKVGHEPIVAANGEEGLEKLEHNYIDLIFCDIFMPVMNGLEMVKAVKAVEAYRFIPIVMFTTESDETLRTQGRALGVSAWMLKPFNEKRFIEALEKLMGKNSSKRA